MVSLASILSSDYLINMWGILLDNWIETLTNNYNQSIQMNLIGIYITLVINIIVLLFYYFVSLISLDLTREVVFQSTFNNQMDRR